jgi:hypothetical protein
MDASADAAPGGDLEHLNGDVARERLETGSQRFQEHLELPLARDAQTISRAFSTSSLCLPAFTSHRISYCPSCWR